ncbi:phage head-tail joining protein [Desulfosporosinus acididurans]|uniref:Phage head-tail joining protein n=1 Tax=Desulfosporosinus acididurans TaxID=476652 RepID=A0A0J1FUS5_9FIRM|nr:phage head closure protein [Desulfosporosinus acididurans]KLU66753.1 phage head-tail joining protein [Desulfosporosinus acididurans]
MIKAGELRHKIEVQKYVRVKNEVGEETKEWQLYKKIWAKFANANIRGQLEQAAEKKTAKIFYKIVIRFRSDIDTTMRVVYGGKTYNIDHVDNDKELNIETHLYCTLIEEGVYNE